MGVPVSALRALWVIKIKTEEKSCILIDLGVEGGQFAAYIAYSRQGGKAVYLLIKLRFARRRRAQRACGANLILICIFNIKSGRAVGGWLVAGGEKLGFWRFVVSLRVPAGYANQGISWVRIHARNGCG